MSSHDAHTVANDTSVGLVPSGANPGPHCQLAPSVGVIVPAVSLEGRQNAPHKSRPVNI